MSDDNKVEDGVTVKIRGKKFYFGVSALGVIGLIIAMLIVAPEFTLNLLKLLIIFG